MSMKCFVEESEMVELFRPEFDLGEFRYAIATYVKLLIRARWKQDSEFLASKELDRWELNNISEDPYPPWRLLEEAAVALGKLNQDFLPRCGSGGVRITDDSTPEGRLITAVAFLASCGGGGPYHNEDLLIASSRSRNDEETDWLKLVDWPKIAKIRDDLDLLPHPDRGIGTTRSTTSNAAQNQFGCFRPVWNSSCRSWEVCFQEASRFRLQDSPGLFYIHLLLQRAGNQVHISELGNAWSGQQRQPKKSTIDSSDISDHEGGLDCDTSWNDGPVLDTRGLDECREEYDRICRDIRNAESDHNSERVAQLQEERRSLSEYIGKAYKPNGDLQLVGNQHKKLLDRVTRAINRSVVTIGKVNRQLEAHLNGSLKTGAHCSYSPENPPKWDL